MNDSTHLVIYTVGHSNHTEKTLLALLTQHGISAVVDVRSVPYSRYTPHFNRRNLEELLKSANIDYHFMGNRLGGRSDDPNDYDPDGRIQYDQLAKSSRFQDGLDSVIRGAKTQRIALMCSEGSPEDCHRSLLLAEELRDACHRISVEHVLPDGAILTQDGLRDRIAKRDDSSNQPNMFLTEEEKIAIAIEEQIERVAFTDKRYAIAQDVLMDEGDGWHEGVEH